LPRKPRFAEIRINQKSVFLGVRQARLRPDRDFHEPGTDKLHGQLQVQGILSSFNSRNHSKPREDGVSSARVQLRAVQKGGNVGGPINKKASFFFNIERRNIGA